MVALQTAILGAVLVVLVVVLVFLLLVLRALGRPTEAVSSDQLTAALSRTLSDLKFEETVGQIRTHAEATHELHADIERMLRDPRERGEFGEHQLDVLLGNHLPPDMYGLREQVVEGKTPDAHIRSASGLVPIDAKFPLDNYERFAAATDEAERERAKRAFRADVERQLRKIADDYVRPEAGTTPFAFAFVPAESVYYHLVTQEYDLLREYTGEGVQVVSPLTFGQKLELIRADVQAGRLTEQAEAIRTRLERLSARFEAVAEEWDTLYTHLRNAKNKADDVERAYDSLRAEFDRIDRPSVDAVEDD